MRKFRWFGLIGMIVILLLVSMFFIGGCTNTKDKTSEKSEVNSEVNKESKVVVEPNKKPEAVLAISKERANINEEIEFNGTESKDPDGKIELYSWNFGDYQTSTEENVTYKYSSGGEYTVSLEVKDNDGEKSKSEKTISINKPPETSINSSATESDTGTEIGFDSFACADSDGQIVKCLWDFGDNQFVEGTQVGHAYINEGDYTVKLTVEDNEGSTNTSTHNLKIVPKRLIIWDAIAMGYITVNSTVSGLSNANTSLEISRNPGAPSLIVIVPAGTRLNSNSRSYQSMLLLYDEEANLTGDTTSWSKSGKAAACINMGRAIPKEGVGFSIGGPKENEQKLIDEIGRGSYSFGAIQLALWAIEKGSRPGNVAWRLGGVTGADKNDYINEANNLMNNAGL